MAANMNGRCATPPARSHEREVLRLATRCAGGVFAAATVVMWRYERLMHETGGPGIIALEVAGTHRRATEIISTWGPQGVAAARKSVWLDFGYMSIYGTFAALLSERARRRHSDRAISIPRYLVPAACVVAVAADACEGVALLHVLQDRDRGTNAARARRAASLKFGALSIVLVYWAASHFLAPTTPTTERQLTTDAV